MDVAFWRSIAELGLGPLLAVLVIYWNRIDTKDREERRRQEAEARLQEAKERASQEREDKLLLIGTLKDVSEALGELKVPLGELRVLLQRINGNTSG